MPPTITRRTALGGAATALVAGIAGGAIGRATSDWDIAATVSEAVSPTSSSTGIAVENIFANATPAAAEVLTTVSADGLPTLTLETSSTATGDVPVYIRSWDADDAPDTFTQATQDAYHTAVTQALAAQGGPDEPLLILNPYGTSTSGLLIGFMTESEGSLTATVSALATPDYTCAVANVAEDTSAAFLGQLIGLVPGVSCTLTLTWTPTRGSATTTTVRVTAPRTASAYPTQVSADLGDDPAATRKQLSDGLFVLTGIIGYDLTTILVDANGTQRGEIVSDGVMLQVPLPSEGRIITSVTASMLGIIEPTGQISSFIDLGDYSIHHDLDVVGDALYVLVTDTSTGRSTVEDVVLAIDLTSSRIAKVIDLAEILPDYLSTTHAREGQSTNDWIHLNSVHVSGDTMYLSSRETSVIIALDGATIATGAEASSSTAQAAATDSAPTVRYLIGATGIWQGTGYGDLFLTKDTDFSENAGQHSLRRIDSDDLPDGRYYLEMFNNNLWYMGTRDDWEDLGPADASSSETQGTSELLRYVVDESAGTVSVDERLDLPYSSVMSNVLRIGDGEAGGGLSAPVVVCSAKAKVFSERTAEGEVIAQYRADSPTGIYRVYKDAFTGFWFE